jgi:hypothetical protein
MTIEENGLKNHGMHSRFTQSFWWLRGKNKLCSSHGQPAKFQIQNVLSPHFIAVSNALRTLPTVSSRIQDIQKAKKKINKNPKHGCLYAKP